MELLDFMSDEPRQAVHAVPGKGAKVPVWTWGPVCSARARGDVGPAFAFASHFAPGQMMQAIALYRAEFKPSAQLAQPYVMLGFNVFAAQSDEQARVLATSMQQAFVNLRTGRPSKLPPPVPGYLESLPAKARAMLDDVLSCSAVGSLTTVRQALHAFVERTGAD